MGGDVTALTGHDRAVSDPVREEVLNRVLPPLVREDAALAEAEIPAIGTQLDRKEDSVRLQASGVLSGLSSLRPDSEAVLSSAIPRLLNVVNTLSSLSPRIPEDALKALMDLMDEADDGLAVRAAYGVARMAGYPLEPRANCDGGRDKRGRRVGQAGARNAGAGGLAPK